ncbi:predicted protein [Histoplasma capsulatum var. duboisii H88]|uniref:Predicted protein n=1 Tax=Ajellomyces capsulatus (strain H88) TaxID=544711 RepID=F0U7F4_AJEC8|nr:predicted protein [Histoplasma capsulatum var. duboisii H88]
MYAYSRRRIRSTASSRKLDAHCSRRWQACQEAVLLANQPYAQRRQSKKGLVQIESCVPNPTPSAEPFSAARPYWLGGRNLIAPDSRRGPNADDLPSCSMLRESLASRLNPRLEALTQKRDWSGRSDLRSMGKVLDTGEPFGTLDQAYGQEFRLLAEGAAIRGDSVVSTDPYKA